MRIVSITLSILFIAFASGSVEASVKEGYSKVKTIIFKKRQTGTPGVKTRKSGAETSLNTFDICNNDKNINNWKKEKLPAITEYLKNQKKTCIDPCTIKNLLTVLAFQNFKNENNKNYTESFVSTIYNTNPNIKNLVQNMDQRDWALFKILSKEKNKLSKEKNNQKNLVKFATNMIKFSTGKITPVVNKKQNKIICIGNKKIRITNKEPQENSSSSIISNNTPTYPDQELMKEVYNEMFGGAWVN